MVNKLVAAGSGDKLTNSATIMVQATRLIVMKRTTFTSLLFILISVMLAAALAMASSDNGARLNNVPVIAMCAALAFLLNWLAFIPAYKAQTEHYYDLTGTATYLLVISVAVLLSPKSDSRAMLVAIMVVLWALRLGSFLFTRVKRSGGDDRFEKIKPNALRFLSVWTIQALWVMLTAACALVIITTENRQPIGLIGAIGIVMWLVGMGIEIVADQQKSSFRKHQANARRFISTGLWAWSRHPNYFGEILLWAGVAVMAMPILQGWQWFALSSPLFVFVLIRYLSGVVGLEKKAEQYWGSEPGYQQYCANTPLLLPRPPRQ